MRSNSCSPKQFTLEMINVPNESGIHPLEASARRIEVSLIESRPEYYEWETPSDAKDTYTVTFIPSKRSKTRPNASVQHAALKTCPCGSIEFGRHGDVLAALAMSWVSAGIAANISRQVGARVRVVDVLSWVRCSEVIFR